MTVGGTATLNSVNNIGVGTTSGFLSVAGTTDIGTTGGTHVLNIHEAGVLTSGGLFSAGTAASTTYINDVWNGNFTTLGGTVLARDSGSVVIENISDSTRTNSGGNYVVGENGESILNIFTGIGGVFDNTGGAGILNSTGNFIIGQNNGSTGIGNIYGVGSQLNVVGNMMTGENAGSNGTLYAWDHAAVHVSGNKTIAGAVNSYGHEYYDGKGTTLYVGDTLTVGEFGFAGGRYTENSLEYLLDQTGGAVNLFGAVGRYQEDPENWFDFGRNIIGSHMEVTAGSPWNPEPLLDANGILWDGTAQGLYSGNAPGLAIVRGAIAESGNAIVGQGRNNLNLNEISNGYVVVDSKVDPNSPDAHSRSMWIVGHWLDENNNPVDLTTDSADWDISAWTLNSSIPNNLGSLTVGDEGIGFLRILNGSLLVSSEAHLSRGANTTGYGGNGTIHVFGHGALYDNTHGDYYEVRDAANKILYTVDFERYGDYYARDPYEKFIADTSRSGGYRTTWINAGPLVIGEGNEEQYTLGVRDNESISLGTVRINDGAYVETGGLFIGYAPSTWGEVSVKGRAAELHVNAFDPADYPHLAHLSNPPQGSGLFSASDYAFVQLNPGANVTISTKALFSNGATLFLNAGTMPNPTDPSKIVIDYSTAPVFSTASGSFNLVNARIVGAGTVGGAGGVRLIQDNLYTSGQAYIDPGLVLPYDPTMRCESPLFYGTLTFGDSLSITGNVVTRFDINADGDQDKIVVKQVSDNASASVFAKLDGTLSIHA